MDSPTTRNYEGIENILLVGGSSQYNVLPYFVEGFKTGFQKAGITTYIYIVWFRAFRTDNKRWI